MISHTTCSHSRIPYRRILQRSFVSSQSSVSFENLYYDPNTGIVHTTCIANTNDNNNDFTKNHKKEGAHSLLFQTIIGLEIHAQLDVPTKLLSSAQYQYATFNSNANSNAINVNMKANSVQNVSAYDMAYPGTLPVLSYHAVKAAILSACALGCEINEVSRFERKHYTYADMPNGYQVTQQRWPIASRGKLECQLVPSQNPNRSKNKNNQQKKSKNKTEARNFVVGIDRIQLEQDSGKTTNATNSNEPTSLSLVDLNRAGCALIEVVFAPDIRSAEEAGTVVSTLQQVLKFIGTCDGKMENGALRCDLNISIAPLNNVLSSSSDTLPFSMYDTGNRVEIKNLNSIRQVIESAEYESLRQVMEHINGRPTAQETRTYDVISQKTVCIRRKEGAVDYRFMPEPDLPPLVLNENTLNGETLEQLISKLPKLPREVAARITEEHGIDGYSAQLIASNKNATLCYEEAVRVAILELSHSNYNSSSNNDVARIVCNWLCNDMFGLLKTDQGIDMLCLTLYNGQRLGTLVSMIIQKEISTTMAKKILSIMILEEPMSDPRNIASSKGYKMITDIEELKQIGKNVIFDLAYERQLKQYANGGKHVTKMEKFFTGKLMAKTKGLADPDLLSVVVQELLSSNVNVKK